MKLLPRSDANELLATVGLRLGNWNEVVGKSQSPIDKWACYAPTDAKALYEFVDKVLSWLVSQEDLSEWLLLQIDNSTSPLTDQQLLFEYLAFRSQKNWDVGTERAFLFENSSGTSRTKIALLIYLFLLFEWHVHLVPRNSPQERRLSLQDGVVYFLGKRESVDIARQKFS